MKIAGMVMIILFTSSLGLMVNKYKKNQIAYIDSVIYISQRLLLMLNTTSPETHLIMDELKNDPKLKNFDFSISNETTPLPDEEINRIRVFFSIIGRYDIDSQINYINEFAGYFKMLREQYFNYYEKHHKLYFVFGFFSGVLISVLLI